jgi:hypothetical protein
VGHGRRSSSVRNSQASLILAVLWRSDVEGNRNFVLLLLLLDRSHESFLGVVSSWIFSLFFTLRSDFFSCKWIEIWGESCSILCEEHFWTCFFFFCSYSNEWWVW